MELLEANDLQALTELLLEYYDKSYYHAQAKRSRDRTELFAMARSADPATLDDLCALGNSLRSPASRN